MVSFYDLASKVTWLPLHHVLFIEVSHSVWLHFQGELGKIRTIFKKIFFRPHSLKGGVSKTFWTQYSSSVIELKFWVEWRWKKTENTINKRFRW